MFKKVEKSHVLKAMKEVDQLSAVEKPKVGTTWVEHEGKKYNGKRLMKLALGYTGSKLKLSSYSTYQALAAFDKLGFTTYKSGTKKVPAEPEPATEIDLNKIIPGFENWMPEKQIAMVQAIVKFTLENIKI